MVFDFGVIGGGVIGCSIARAVAERFPTKKVALLEKENQLAYHTSGRNSGVVHAGFNARPGTMKAKFAVEGNRRLEVFCKSKNVAFRRTGKVVIAQTEGQEKTIEELYARGTKSGVPGLKIIERTELKKIEPYAEGRSALYSPSSAIVDSQALVYAYASDLLNHSGAIFTNFKVNQVKHLPVGFEVTSSRGNVLRTRFLINCAGLYADKIAHKVGVGHDYIIAPFRGEYYEFKAERNVIVNGLIYPAPDLELPFLGVHFTKTVTGQVLVGPNAVIAMGRESYNNSTVNVMETARLIFSRNFTKLLSHRRFFDIAMHEVRKSLSKSVFLEEAKKLVPSLVFSDLVKSRAGIRAQLLSKDGKLVEDLVVERSVNAIHVLNAVSPALTSSLPFSEYIANLIEEQQ